jgi:hypothetical protein
MQLACEIELMTLVQKLRHEPLLSFVFIGVAIFALNAWLNPPTQPPSDTIVIEQSRIDSWQNQFRSGNGRLPSKAEQQATIGQWIDEEILYRQAFFLGLHQNDSIVRRQLIRKMEFVIEGATPLPPATDDKLQAFIDSQQSVYNTQAKTSFQQVFFSRGGQSSAEVADQLASLQAAPESFNGVGDSFIVGQHIRNADDTLIRKHFGKQFVDELQSLPSGAGWQGPIHSGLGLHLVRIVDRTSMQAPTLGDIRKKVALDYRLYQEQLARRKALDELQTLYRVTIDGKAYSVTANPHSAGDGVAGVR